MSELEQIVSDYIAAKIIQGIINSGIVFDSSKIFKPVEKSTKDVALEITKLARKFEKPKIKWLEICKFTNEKKKDEYIIIQG